MLLVTKKAEDTRNQRIDILRGISIFMVMFMHFWIIDGPLRDGSLHNIGSMFAANAVYGVVSFFVISGYLITSHIIRRYGSLEAISLRQFYWMRFCRIAPPLIIILIINVLLAESGASAFRLPAEMPIYKPVIAVLTFTFNIFRSHFGSAGLLSWDIFWSLSVEEMFYLLFPIFCFAAGRHAIRWLIIIFIYGVIYRGLYGTITDNGAAFDAMAAGCFVAIILERTKTILPPLILGGGIVVGWIGFWTTYFFIPHMAHAWSPTMMIVSVAILVATAAMNKKTLSPFCSFLTLPLRVVGKYSYELYLIHGIIAIAIVTTNIGAFKPIQVLAIYLGVTIIIAVAFGRVFSEPINGYLRHLQKTK